MQSDEKDCTFCALGDCNDLVRGHGGIVCLDVLGHRIKHEEVVVLAAVGLV